MMRNRIVAVSYLNTIPFIYGIEHAGIDLHADLLLSPPRGCASLLRDGGAEIALIPVAAVPSIPDIRIVRFARWCWRLILRWIGSIRFISTAIR